MRRLLMMALLAGVAGPAMAQDGRGDGRRERAQAREEARQERQERRSERRSESSSSSSKKSEDKSPAPRQMTAPRIEPVQRQSEPTRERRASGDSVRDWRARDRSRPDSPTAVEQRNVEAQAPAEIAPVAESPRRSIGDRMRRVADRDRPLDRNVRTTPPIGERRGDRIGRNVPAEGTAPPPPTRAQIERGQTTRHWRGDWRRDNRYDWRKHRDRNRSRFRLGFYFDPFGWHYRRYNIGWRLWPSYYHSSYWLNDPWQYRLPPAYGPYRWIRYHDDALLVNIYTGEVVDVIYSFFW